MSTKQVIAKGVFPDHWETYSDGSAMAVCMLCEKEDKITPERFEKIQTIPNWYKQYTCYKCWSKGKDASKNAERKAEKKQTQSDIQFGQALNLAFQAALKVFPLEHELFWGLVENYHTKINEKISELKSKVGDNE